MSMLSLGRASRSWAYDRLHVDRFLRPAMQGTALEAAGVAAKSASQMC
jgi:hypothetical protein